MPERGEIEWFAVDGAGHIGMFNPEYGIVPASASVQLNDGRVDDWFYEVLDWCSDCRTTRKLVTLQRPMFEKHPNARQMEEASVRAAEEWYGTLAKKGVFTFASVTTRNGETRYCCVCRPQAPITIHDIHERNPAVAAIVAAMAFPHVDYLRASVIDVMSGQVIEEVG